MTAPGPAPMDWLLGTTAGYLPTGAPNALLTPDHLALMAVLAVWEWHGPGVPTPESIADRQALRDALDRISINGDTRAEYAARLQLAAKGAVL